MKKSSQWLLSVVAVGLTGAVVLPTYTKAGEQANAFPNTKQQITARQVATLLDQAHYLDRPIDQAMGKKMLDTYIDYLDPNRSLFLQADVDEFHQKYAATYGDRLKRGDLSAGLAVFERYRLRSDQYYAYANNLLSGDPDLNTSATIVLDREDLPRFGTAASQKDYWRNQTLYALINITLGQQNEKARDKAFLERPELSRGQDLIKNETRTPKEILLRRLKRSQEQLERLKDDEIVEGILNSAMLTYDPHSNYFAPILANEMQIQSNLQLEGIGVSIRADRKNPDYTRIVSLVDGGPAAKSGQIKPNDLIVGVAQDGEPMVDVVGYSVREIVALIRGKRGTSVTLKVKPASGGQERNVVLVRDVIRQEESGVHRRVVEVEYKGATKRVGVLEIPSFYLNFQARRSGQVDYRSVSADTEKALKELNRQNIDGLVVDLRGNPGGSLDEVAKMLGFFIKSGPVVQIRDNRGNVVVYEDDDGGKELYSGDMAVLINLASASASEIFAAAIQDYGRGLVVGSATTGKGSAQSQRDDLILGSANITQRKFYRVNGDSTQNKGVIPDVELVNIYESANFGERAYKNPLPWDTIASANYTPYGKYNRALIAQVNQKSQARQATDAQFVYLQKLNAIADLDDDKKPRPVNLQKRQTHARDIEARTLMAENVRRQATGELPYTDWATYQASLDALLEEYSAMKENERPKLPESEAFVVEAARALFDAQSLKQSQKQ